MTPEAWSGPSSDAEPVYHLHRTRRTAGLSARHNESVGTNPEKEHMSQSPYSGLPPSQFWKTAVAEKHPTQAEGLYRRKFEISPTLKIATAGSCFAQHIGKGLKKRGFNLLDVEPPPHGLSGDNATRYGFNIYSARYGNIYLVRQLLQLAREAFGDFQPAEPVWEREGRYFDAMRPSVEPHGFSSAEEVAANRRSHLSAVRTLIESAELFVFTLGLTEGWQHTHSGTVYPTAPGTLVGSHDPRKYSFKNFTYEEIKGDFLEFRELARRRNPALKFLLTVSPVPLTATASDKHVLVATTYSKSVLRAVAGDLCASHEDIDYFPSFEIIASPWSRGFFYEANLRSVTELGVSTVMNVFFGAHDSAGAGKKAKRKARGRAGKKKEARAGDVCEEVLLDAFAKSS
jgi:hypothetical protein